MGECVQLCDSRDGKFWNIGHCSGAHSALMFAARITLAHFPVSAAMCLLRSSGKPGKIMVPNSASRVLILASASAAFSSLLSLSIISDDVLLGAPTPYHPLASNPTTDSPIVGTSGSTSERVAVVMASARSLPVLMNSIEAAVESKLTCTCPPIRSVNAGAVIIASSAPVLAQQHVADFYRGRTLRIIVGAAVGSGYDVSARLIARHLSARIPGNPTMVIQNQPGASSMTMVNQLYSSGPFDGTVIGAPNNGIPAAALLQLAGVRYDPMKLNWIASSNRETQVTYVWHSAPVQSLNEFFNKTLIVGAQQPGTGGYDLPMLTNALFGTKFKLITGYEGTLKINLAMEGGEVQGSGANWSTLKATAASWINEGKIKVIAQWALKRHPDISDVPMMFDLAKTEADRQALLLAMARFEFGRPFFLPPNVPAERVQALRDAFNATMKDREFLAEAVKLKIDIEPYTGEQVAALVEQVMRTPPEIVSHVRAAIEKK